MHDRQAATLGRQGCCPRGSSEKSAELRLLRLLPPPPPPLLQVDVWAVGVLAYELMMQETPFFQESQQETERLIMRVRGYFFFGGGLDWAGLGRLGL